MIALHCFEGVLICLHLKRTETQVVISVDGLMSLLWFIMISWAGHCDPPARHSGLHGYIVTVLAPHAA